MILFLFKRPWSLMSATLSPLRAVGLVLVFGRQPSASKAVFALLFEKILRVNAFLGDKIQVVA